MLRIARIKKSTYLTPEGQDDQHFAEYQQLTKLIKKHFSAVTASIFAQPNLLDNSDDIEWYSELKGQPQSLLSLPEDQQLNAKKLLSDRLTALNKLAEQLPQLEPGSEKLQALLKKAVQYPGDKSVYVVNGQPVITFWGIPDPSVKKPNAPLPKIPGSTIASNIAKPKSRLSRFLSVLAWLLLFALLAGLLWYWFSKNPVNWQDYNPFVDEYQQLLDTVNAADDDCAELDLIYTSNPLINKTEERFILLKKQVESKLEICEAYLQLKKEIQLAQGDCTKLAAILNHNQYLQNPQKPFIELKVGLKQDVKQCVEYKKLKSEIDAAKNDCSLLTQINTENPYLQQPEGMFIALKEQVQTDIQACHASQIQNQIDEAKDDCDKLKRINTENPYLQQPESIFILLKQQLEQNIKECSAYQSLEDTIDKAQLDCEQLKKLASENQYLQNPEGKFIALKKQLLSYQKNCKRKQIENIVNLCPGERPKKLAPELVVVVDDSGSMAYPPSVSKSKKIDRQLQQTQLSLGFSALFGGQAFANQQLEQMFYRLSPPNKSRMQGAKTAVNRLVKKTPSDMDIGLVVLNDCPSARSFGFYSPAKRKQFLGKVNRLKADGGTPLGDAIRRAGKMIDGVNKPATMVVISDGENSCGPRPCAIARKLAAQKPYLTINVVDILGTGAGNCIARATKNGKVFTARNMQDIIRMTEKAANTAIPKNCKK